MFFFHADNKSSTACERFPLAHCRAFSAASRENPILSNSSSAKFRDELHELVTLGLLWSESKSKSTAWEACHFWVGWNIGSSKAFESPPAAAMIPSAVSSGNPVTSASSSAWVFSRGLFRDKSRSCCDGRLESGFLGGESLGDKALILPTFWKINGMCSSMQALCSCSNLALKQENGCPLRAHSSAKATRSVLRQQWPSESKQSYWPSSVFQPAARTKRTFLFSSEAISGYLRGTVGSKSNCRSLLW